MLTFAISLHTDEGRATVYTDEIEQFLEAHEVEVAPIQPCQMQASGVDMLAPYLEGYSGPFVKGETDTGDLIVGYCERPSKKGLV